MRYILNAIFPTMGVEVVPTGPYVESSCAQGELGGPAKVPWQDCSSSGHPLPDLSLLLGHPVDPHCVQPACASQLATKHAKPTAQKSNEATCGTSARLPQTDAAAQSEQSTKGTVSWFLLASHAQRLWRRPFHPHWRALAPVEGA